MKINLPNKLTLIRIALIPVFVVLAEFEIVWCQLAAAVVFCVACVTDYLDGNIACKHNLVTNFGKFADPLADKMLVTAAMLKAKRRVFILLAFIFAGVVSPTTDMFTQTCIAIPMIVLYEGTIIVIGMIERKSSGKD